MSLLHVSISEMSVQKGTVELIGASWWHGLKENLLAALTLSVKNKLAEGEEFCLGFEMADFLQRKIKQKWCIICLPTQLVQ